MRDFKKLLIWQRGMDLVESVYRVAAMLPENERYGLRTQATRAAVSIVLNIAEGSAKSSKKDYRNYLSTSLGSAFELETALLIIQRLELADGQVVDPLMNDLLREQRMINSFINRLKSDG